VPADTQQPDRFAAWHNDARRTLVYADQEARRIGDGFIGDEHLLLGLLRLESGIAHDVLAALGLTLDRAREVVAAMSDRAAEGLASPEYRLAPRCKVAVEQTVNEARLRRVSYVASEHILLALTRVRPGGFAAPALLRLGVTPQAVHDRTREALVRPSAARPPRPSALRRLLHTLLRRNPK
jgi:ATP-dependent Clp protease ATP-binding subunit ClpC